MRVRTIAPTGVIKEGEFKSIKFKTPEGEVKVLPEHAPYTALISPCTIYFDGDEIPCSGGVISVEEEITIFLERSL